VDNRRAGYYEFSTIGAGFRVDEKGGDPTIGRNLSMVWRRTPTNRRFDPMSNGVAHPAACIAGPS